MTLCDSIYMQQCDGLVRMPYMMMTSSNEPQWARFGPSGGLDPRYGWPSPFHCARIAVCCPPGMGCNSPKKGKDPAEHDDVIKWKHLPRYWPFVRGIHQSPVNSPHKGQWRGALVFSLICVWINGWVNNREAGDLRHYRTHSDVTVMSACHVVCMLYSTPEKVSHTVLVVRWHGYKHVQQIHKKYGHRPFGFLSWRHYMNALLFHWRVAVTFGFIILPVAKPIWDWAQGFYQLWKPDISTSLFKNGILPN